jgi:hypothetical protein
MRSSENAVMARSLALFSASLLWIATPVLVSAQLPDCSGHDPGAASVEFEAGNALLTQAIDQASHRHADRARELAAQALTRFDRQCELGDTSAFAERGAALLLLGEPLRSAQSYDAYLATHALDSLDARTRRRIEPNLQPGTLVLDVQNPRGHVFLNDLDFGAVPRTTPIRVPYAEYRVELRGDTGEVIVADVATLSAEASQAEVHLFVAPPQAEVAPPPPDTTPPPVDTTPPPPPPERFDFLPFYIASAVTAGVGLAFGIGFVVAADERARTYNSLCNPVAIAGCDSVLSERDTFLDIGIVGFVVGGLGIAGLVTTWILDANAPRGHVRVTFGPTGLSLHGTF